MRTIAAGIENDLDKKYIDISLKSSIDKLPALKQVKPDREAADFQRLRLSKGILKEISGENYASKQEQLREIHGKRNASQLGKY